MQVNQDHPSSLLEKYVVFLIYIWKYFQLPKRQLVQMRNLIVFISET